MLIQVSTTHGKPFRRAGISFGPRPVRLWCGPGRPPGASIPVIDAATLARLEQATGKRGPLHIERDAVMMSADAPAVTEAAAATSRAAELAEANAALVKVVDELRPRLDEALAREDALENELTELRGAYDASRKRAAELDQALAAAGKREAELVEELAAVKKRMADLARKQGRKSKRS